MQSAPLLCVLWLAGTAAWAQNGPELMKTPECLAARKLLDEAFAAGGPRGRIDAAREYTAIKCFGVKASPSPDKRFVPPPVSGDPIRLRTEPSQPIVPSPPPLPPIAIPRAPAVTSCDATGCWDSNGSRHNQQGPVLVGPKGMCTVQGGVLNCP